jgi:hypothetical protein
MRSLLLALAFAACSSSAAMPPDEPPPPPAPTPPPIVAPAPTQSLPFPVAPGEAPFRTVRSQRFQLSLPLPDRAGWSLDPEKGSSFLVMRHAATASTLVVRRWLAQAPMNRARCEEAVRLIRDLPAREGELASRFLDVPPGFDTRVDVGAAAGPEGPQGWLLAFGASGRRCFAFVYTTEATGPDAEQVVGDRLAVIQTMVLERIVVHRDTDVELPRRALD